MHTTHDVWSPANNNKLQVNPLLLSLSEQLTRMRICVKLVTAQLINLYSTQAARLDLAQPFGHLQQRLVVLLGRVGAAQLRLSVRRQRQQREEVEQEAGAHRGRIGHVQGRSAGCRSGQRLVPLERLMMVVLVALVVRRRHRCIVSRVPMDRVVHVVVVLARVLPAHPRRVVRPSRTGNCAP